IEAQGAYQFGDLDRHHVPHVLRHDMNHNKIDLVPRVRPPPAVFSAHRITPVGPDRYALDLHTPKTLSVIHDQVVTLAIPQGLHIANLRLQALARKAASAASPRRLLLSSATA